MERLRLEIKQARRAEEARREQSRDDEARRPNESVWIFAVPGWIYRQRSGPWEVMWRYPTKSLCERARDALIQASDRRASAALTPVQFDLLRTGTDPSVPPAAQRTTLEHFDRITPAHVVQDVILVFAAVKGACLAAKLMTPGCDRRRSPRPLRRWPRSPFTPGRRIYVDALVNGEIGVRLLFDTGADRTAIDPTRLRAAGLVPLRTGTVSTETAEVAVVDLYEIDSLEMGGARVGPLTVWALTENSYRGRSGPPRPRLPRALYGHHRQRRRPSRR